MGGEDADGPFARGLVCPQLDAEVRRLVESIVAKPRVAIDMGKRFFYSQLDR
jgi:hypothetical protein